MNKAVKSLLTLPVIIATLVAIASCDNTDNIGASLIQTQNKIFICDSFTLSGLSVDNDKVQSRTSMQLIGDIDAKGYGNFSSDFVTQFLPVARIDSLLTCPEQIDSIKLLMLFEPKNYIGDSIMPMGLEVFRLNRQLQTPIYSDFDPADYYDPADRLGSTVYTASAIELPTDSLRGLSYREIYVDLPRQLALDLFDLYLTNPDAYLSPSAFAKHFPGIYVRSNYGSGRVTQVGASLLRFYYHLDTKNAAGRDTTYRYANNFFTASPEVISNNIIAYDMSEQLHADVDRGQALVVAPAGLDVEITFPLRDIIDYYRANAGELSVINNLTMSIPAHTIANDYGIKPPTQLLMVLKKDRDAFFRDSQVTDGITSFYATYSSTGSYDFSSMRQYLINAINAESITPDDYTFILTPVTVSTENVYDSSAGGYVTHVNTVVPYVQKPVMARLDLDAATIRLTFSNQTAK